MQNDRTDPEHIASEARVWLRTLTSGDVKPWDAEAFKRWLNMSPAHAAAFREAKQRWATLKPGVGEMLRTQPQVGAWHSRMRERAYRSDVARPGRRVFLGAAMATAAAVGVAVIHPPGELWPAPGQWGADFRTATGEQQNVVLNDRVSVTLNTQTSISRRLIDARLVGMNLLDGEAAIDVKATGKPFEVMAGVGRSLIAAGRCELRYLAGRTWVTCIEGEMQVQHPAGTRGLAMGQQMVYDERSASSVIGVTPAEVSAWRRGELVFRSVRLSDVLAEINRYRTGRVVLMNDAVRTSPVSGRFAIASLDTALAQLQHSFNLHARALPGGLLVLS